MKNILLTFYKLLLFSFAATAQETSGGLDIQFNKNILQPGDSLLITVGHKQGGGTTSSNALATLELLVENEQGNRTRFRWPVINGQATGTLYLPDSLPQGKYTLFAALQSRFFEVVGKVKDVKRNPAIQAMLLTKSGEWDEQRVDVARDGSFAIRNWLFEDNALVAFSDIRNSKQQIDISISTQLDSTYTPLAVGGKAFYVGTPSAAVRETLAEPVQTSGSTFRDGGTLLPAVVVRSVAKTPAQQFNEEHVTGMFRSADERLISILDDPSALGFPNIFSYLQGRIAGLQIAQAGFAGGAARWRGNRVTFFLDEMRVSPQQIASIPMSDVAIVKAFPPPFFGAPGGGGAVAIYTRRGGEASYLPANRQVFRVRGYTPSATVLHMNKLTL